MKKYLTGDNISGVMLTIMLVFLGIFFFWMLYPYKVIDFKPIELVKKEYQAGEPLEIVITYCKYMPLPATMSRQFMNGIIFTLSDAISSNVSTGCGTNISADIIIPKELLPDTYIYKQTMVYEVNPIRDIIVVFETPEFKIVK